MKDGIKIIYTAMPETIRGFALFVVRTGKYTIFINEKLNEKDRERTLQHELHHIENGDFFSDESVNAVERRAHESS